MIRIFCFSLEICSISTISVKEIGRCFNKLKQSLQDSVFTPSIEMNSIIVCLIVFEILFFINYCFLLKPRFCSQLNLQGEILIRKTAIHVAERAMEVCDIQGRAPSSVASAAIYMTCLIASEKRTKKGKKNFIFIFLIIKNLLIFRNSSTNRCFRRCNQRNIQNYVTLCF